MFRNTTDNPITIDVSYTRTSITASLIGVSDVADVRAIRTGSATTSGGGTVTIQRVITYRDGRTVVETRTHTYRGLPSDDDDDHVHDDQPPPDDGTGPQSDSHFAHPISCRRDAKQWKYTLAVGIPKSISRRDGEDGAPLTNRLAGGNTG